MIISGDLVAEFASYLAASVGAFLPLLLSFVGTFAAFGIARRIMHMLRLK